jgi:hypothetical protein
LEVLTQAVKKRTEEARLYKKSELLSSINEDSLPVGKTEDEVVEEFLTKAVSDEDSTLKVLEGKKDLYIYDSKKMADSYAEILKNQEDEDIPKMIADTIRRDSKIYPRPTDKRVFSHAPFNLDTQTLTTVLESMKKDEEYADIKVCTASNGVDYLYSNQHLLEDQAIYLTEWYEVEEELNP